MNVSRATVAVLGIGVAILAGTIISPGTLAGPTWVSLALVYLLAGTLFGIAPLRTGRESLDFRYSVGVAATGTVVAIGLRTWDLLGGYRTPPLAEIPYVLQGPELLVPLAVAFMLPLGVARRNRERLGVVAVVGLPFLVSTVVGVLRGFGFGPRFAVMYHLLLFVGGVVGGLPLFVYGRRLRWRRSPASVPDRTREPETGDKSSQ